MIDKDTQIDANENIPAVIYNRFKQFKVRKISIPVMPTAYSFKIDTNVLTSAEHHRFPSRCGSRKELKAHNFRRNNSECQLRPPTAKINSVINLSFNHKPPKASRRILENQKPEMKLRNVRYILRY